jgi:Leucine-rich repeat (LRR) protein
MNKLQKLSATNNGIVEFPATVVKLISLNQLDLSFNKMSLLPDNFGDLNKLILLDLSNNELLNFPQDQIDVFASLLKLNISRNHIDVMPIGFPYLYRLKALEVCCNDLKALPVELDKMKNLEILDISDNIIETLPERICKMPALKKLDCSDNKITKGFPKAWENLRQKCTVAYGDQSSFKSREVRERPSDKEAETQSSPKGGKKGIGKKKVGPMGTPPMRIKSKSMKSAPP